MVSCVTEFIDPKPESDLKVVDSGLLSPEGKFYRCAYEEHDWLARALDKNIMTSWELVKQGWLKFTNGTFTRVRDFHFKEVAACPDVSQRQLDAIWDWCQAKGGRFLPNWYSEIR